MTTKSKKKDIILSAKKSTQSLIPFSEVYSDNVLKIGEKSYCIICEYNNTEYSGLPLSEKEAKYEAYKEAMNSLNPKINYQEFIMNESIKNTDYERVIIPKKSSLNDDEIEAFEDFISIQKDMIKKCVIKTSYKKTLIALSYTLSNDYDDYECLFHQLEVFKEAFSSLGSNIRQLEVEEILEYIYKYYRPFDNTKLQIPDNYIKLGRNIKDYLVPMSVNFKSKEVELGGEYSRVLGLSLMTYNQSLSDDIINNILDNRYHITVSKHIRRMDKAKVTSILRRKETAAMKRKNSSEKENTKTGVTGISRGLEKRLADVTQHLLELERADQEIFEVVLLVSISAETKNELDAITNLIKEKALDENGVKFDTLTHNQKRGFLSMMPFAINNFSKGADDSLSLHLMTDACGVLIPFSSTLYYDEDGFLYGIDRVSKYPLLIDRKKGINSNGFILAMSGAGKSVFSKEEDLQIYYRNPLDYIIIFDPEGEYNRILNMIDGEEIVFSPISKNHINIFEVTQTELLSKDFDASTLIAEKRELATALLSAMKGKNLNSDETSLLHSAIKELYKPLLTTLNLLDDMPTLNDLYDVLDGLKNEDENAKRLSKILNCYLDKGSMLSGRSNISLQKRYTIFNLSKCKGIWRSIANTLLLHYSESKGNELFEEGKTLWLKVDELHTFLINENESEGQAAIFLDNSFKRLRKKRHVIQGIMQNVEQAMNSPTGIGMIKNSNFVVMLRQHKRDALILKDMYSLNDKQYEFLLTAPQGEGLIYFDGRVVQFDNKIPKDSLTYKLLNTTEYMNV